MSSKKPSEPGVLGSLPSTRPARLGRRREGGGTATASATPKATKAAPKAANGGAAKTAPKARPKTSTGPRAVRSGSPSLKRPAKTARDRPRPARPPRGAELVTTAVKATGELAQIGFTVGGQVLRRAAKRLPRP